MEKQEMEKIRSYIDFKIVKLDRKLLICFLLFLLMVGVPNIMIGVVANWTNKIYILFFMIMVLFGCYFFINTNSKIESQVLFHGVYFLFVSCSMLSLAYKIADFVIDFTMFQRLLYIGSCIAILVILIIEKLLKVKGGYYLGKAKSRNLNSLIYASSFGGLFIGRLTVGSISQEMMPLVLSILLLVLSFIFAFGILSILKFYLMIKLKNSLKHVH